MITTNKTHKGQHGKFRRFTFALFVLVILEAFVIVVLSIKCVFAKNQQSPLSVPVVLVQKAVKQSNGSILIRRQPAVSGDSDFLHSDDIPLSYELQDVMQQACENYDVPYALALGIAECESSFNLEADSGVCWGLMQIHPINYDRLRKLGIEPTDYEGNIAAGVFLIGELLDKYDDPHKALMAYNCGESGAADLWQQGRFSSQYSRRVTNAAEHWQHIIDNLKSIEEAKHV